MSDARPSGPQTAACHDDQGRVTGTHGQNYSETGEDERSEANGDQGEGGRGSVPWREQSSHSVQRRVLISLSARSTQQVHKRLSLSVCVLSFLFTADLPCSRALRCFCHAESGQNRHLQSRFPRLSRSTVLKNRKKQTSDSLRAVIAQLLRSLKATSEGFAV